MFQFAVVVGKNLDAGRVAALARASLDSRRVGLCADDVDRLRNGPGSAWRRRRID